MLTGDLPALGADIWEPGRLLLFTLPQVRTGRQICTGSGVQARCN